MSLYRPEDNNIRDVPIYLVEEAIIKNGFDREAIIPEHFTVGKSKPEQALKESENNG